MAAVERVMLREAANSESGPSTVMWPLPTVAFRAKPWPPLVMAKEPKAALPVPR